MSQSLDWTAYYQREHQIQRFTPAHDPAESLRADFVRSLWPAQPVASVLDAGCGDGYQCSLWAREIPRVVGCDLSPARVAFARQLGSAARFTAGELHRLPFRDRTFDLVILCEVLEHMEDPVATLRAVAAKSRRSFLVTVPYKQVAPVVMCPHCLKTFPVDGHLQTFDRASFVTALTGAGLRPVRVELCHQPSPWERAVPFRWLPAGGRRLLRRGLQAAKLISPDNARFIGALCEVG
jgi:SAM-dependent methyltransferase